VDFSSLALISIHICDIQSIKAQSGLSISLSSPTKVTCHFCNKQAKAGKNLIHVPDCPKYISTSPQFKLLTPHSTITEVQLSSIFIPKSLRAFIINLVSSLTKIQFSLVFHSVKLASIKTLLVIDLDHGSVNFFILSLIILK